MGRDDKPLIPHGISPSQEIVVYNTIAHNIYTIFKFCVCVLFCFIYFLNMPIC